MINKQWNRVTGNSRCTNDRRVTGTCDVSTRTAEQRSAVRRASRDGPRAQRLHARCSTDFQGTKYKHNIIFLHLCSCRLAASPTRSVCHVFATCTCMAKYLSQWSTMPSYRTFMKYTFERSFDQQNTSFETTSSQVRTHHCFSSVKRTLTIS